MNTTQGISSLLGSADHFVPPACWRKVLLVDDDPAFLRIAQVILAHAGYQVTTAGDGEEAMFTIAQSPPDFVVTDWKMPGVDGIQLCQWVRETPWERYIYMMVVSGRTETRHIVQAVAAGADDFMSKPIQAGELLARMQAGQRILERERQLHFLARYDQLTEVFNRRTLFEELDRRWHQGRRANLPLACVMGDVDDFKAVNDHHGHLVGDQVLKVVAGVLRRLARKDDLVGRYGGEEFCVLLAGASERDAALWAEQCRAEIAAMTSLGGSLPHPVTMSLGVASQAADIAAPQQLLKRADDALLAAKRRGKNRVVFYGGEELYVAWQ